MTSIPYAWSDSWLLLSVLFAASTEGATLDGIISVGDAINHAIFTFHEIDGGLARLLAEGLVRIDGKHVLPTDEATRLYEQVRRGSLLSQMEALGKKIGAPPASTAHDPNRADSAWSVATFSKADLQRAYTNYSARSRPRRKDKKGRGAG